MRIIYYDTETTGVRSESDRIVEFAAYDPERELTFSTLINPGISIPSEASAIHGITNEMVQNAPSFAEVGAALVAFCEGEIVLAAHNNDAFDALFLKHEFKRAELELPPFPMLDTLKWARKYRPDLPRHSLQYLRQVFGIAENQAHRALDDVMVLYEIFSIMIDDLPVKKVMELLHDNAPLGTMPFGKYKGVALEKVPTDYITWLEKQGVFEKPENRSLKEALDANKNRSVAVPK